MQVLNNTFSTLNGSWSHAVALAGPTPNAVVKGNKFDTLTTTSSTFPLSNNVAVFFEANPVGDTVTVTANQFNGSDFYGVVVAPADIAQYDYIVLAEDNWWNSPCGPSVIGPGDGAGVGLRVDYDPWLGTPDGGSADPSPLTISLPNPTTARLTWNGNKSNTYNIYRETDPYFTPTTVYATATGSTYDDAKAVGDPAENHYYVVSLASPSGGDGGKMTNRVGEFDFALVPGQ
jgi:hypothetical protein